VYSKRVFLSLYVVPHWLRTDRFRVGSPEVYSKRVFQSLMSMPNWLRPDRFRVGSHEVYSKRVVSVCNPGANAAFWTKLCLSLHGLERPSCLCRYRFRVGSLLVYSKRIPPSKKPRGRDYVNYRADACKWGICLWHTRWSPRPYEHKVACLLVQGRLSLASKPFQELRGRCWH
jgi:hypothetical protein